MKLTDINQIGIDSEYKIKEAREIFFEASRNQLVSMEKEIFNLLKINNEETINKLPEYIFIDFFLPYFSGKLNIEDSQEPITKWIGIAGSPTKEVDIIDSVSGNVLFRVPPLINTSKLNIIKTDKKTTANEMLAMAARKADSGIPGSESVYLMSMYPLKVKQLTENNEIDKDDKVRWEYIFNRYGIKILDNKIEVQKEKVTDFYDYDNSFELVE